MICNQDLKGRMLILLKLLLSFSIIVFNPIQDGHFAGCLRRGRQKDPLPEIWTVIPYLKKIQKIYESRDIPLDLC